MGGHKKDITFMKIDTNNGNQVKQYKNKFDHLQEVITYSPFIYLMILVILSVFRWYNQIVGL
jgi:hypothetical protein